MVIKFKELVLTADTKFDESIEVEGSISCKGGPWNIDCQNINCRNIDCRNINCQNINCLDIDCQNINCLDIDCLDIDCQNINCQNINCLDIVFCQTAKIKKKLKAKVFIKGRFDMAQKEWKV